MTTTSQHPFYVAAQWAVVPTGPSHPVLTPSQIRALYMSRNPDGHCFDRKSMRFFGDTMRNFRAVRTVDGYRLDRRRAVKHGIRAALCFSAAGDYIGTVQP